jgi:hypothetical protein
VAGLAIDFRFVGGPIGGNLGRLLSVAFDTIVNRQYGLFSECNITKAADKDHGQCRNQQLPRMIFQHLDSSFKKTT